MAFSQPTDDAQTPAVCQLCEESSDIRWKCINCDVFMCQLCTTKIHTKLKSTDKHELINLKDLGSENAAKTICKVDLQNMPCTVHNDQMCFAFCTDCDQPVCLDCLIESHEKHKFRKLNEVYDIAISEMKELQNKLETCLQFYGNEKERFEKLLLDGDKKFQEIKDQILLTEKEIKETVSKYAKELLQELESKWKPTENKITSELAGIQKNQEDLTSRETSLKKTLQSHQASEILSSRKKLDMTLPEISVESVNCDVLKTKFLSGNKFEKQNTRSTIFGDLYAVPDLELVRSYQSDFGNVLDILNCDNNTSFIACYIDRKLQKVKFEENNIKVEEDFSIQVRNMAISMIDEILLVTGESDIKVISVDKQFKQFKSFSPLKAISVHVSQNNEILVGLTECYPVTFPAPEDSVRRVVVLNQDSDLQHTYEYDKDNKKLFTEPRKIITLNDNIYIIDKINAQWEGRVIVIDYGGQLLWVYKGCDNNVNKNKFYPTDITSTSSNSILISDQQNHAIHVLNPAGDVIVCKDIKPLGIELPLSLSIDINGILWIGCNTFKVDKDGKAKIFAVKNG
ncbi:tripartite motif-containing protein 2/3 [Mytilus galloprovincialis]|uniref:Tripartite motif-containing protein 2/3 n=1 Tax=Mytilus galloprovincialis TaxID=29158 RepID=A0A8B6FWA6_MYTGA|nr:tripartite motif-containing protein 2/3 [Mytilus galloprovincialis]